MTKEKISTKYTAKRSSLSVPLPSNISTTHILIVLLLVASFLLGALTTKLQYLESGQKGGASLGSNLQAATQNQPVQQISQAPAGKIKEITDKDHIRGNKNAKVTLVEYSDYECPFCKTFHPTMQELMKTYGEKIRWVYRDYPLSFHQNAAKEAEASECIAKLGGEDAFWKYTDTIFERTTSNGTGFALNKLGSLAAEFGVDQTAFQQCLDSGEYTQHVKDQTADGTTGGVSGTPSTFIIDSKGQSKLIVGAQGIDAFKAVIDQALQ